MEAYQAFFARRYAGEYPDSRRPSLLYVVLSEARRAGIEKVGLSVLGGDVESAVLVLGRTTPWLEAKVFGTSHAPAKEGAEPDRGKVEMAPYPPGLSEAAKNLYGWTNQLLRELKSHGELARLATEQPAFIAEGSTVLRSLYEHLQGEARHGS